MVVMNLRLELSKLQKPKINKSPQFKLENFNNKVIRKTYQQKVDEHYNNADTKDNNERWQRIVDTCLQTGEEVIGTKDKKKKDEDKEIKRLADMRQEIKRQIIDSTTSENRNKLRNERKYIKKEIDKRLKKKEEKELDMKLEHLEKIKDDNTKYHYVLRDLNKPKHKVPIMVKDKEGNVPGSTAAKIQVIGEYFKKTLAPDNMKDQFISPPPCPMIKKFTAEEIKSIAQRLGNNKAAGPDQLHAEFIKHAPMSIFKDIAEIYNTTAETGDIPTALIHGRSKNQERKKVHPKIYGPSFSSAYCVKSSPLPC